MDILDINKDLRQLLTDSNDPVDKFLINNYRYDSIDVLLQDLSHLNHQLNQELIELINQNFKQFIDLSSNLKDSESLIQLLTVNLDGFNQLISRIINKFTQIHSHIESQIDVSHNLQVYKFKINTILLINSMIKNMEMLLNQQIEQKQVMSIEPLKAIINLMLNINKLIMVVDHPVVNGIRFKALIREFVEYMGEVEVKDSFSRFEVFKMKSILGSIGK